MMAAMVAPTAAAASSSEPSGASRTALIIDGSYALIGARNLGGKIDYVKLRSVLEEQAATQFGDCWFFDQNPVAQLNASLTAEYHMLKFARPDGPQFQVSLFPMKKYSCHCRNCGNNFTQNVQKGVDNGIATKILSLAYENICDRFILFAGDGDFYSSLSHARNVLRKDIWVIGYRGTVSGDLQQLASRVIWMNDLWAQVKNERVNGRERGRRDGSRQMNDTGSTTSNRMMNESSPVDSNEEMGDRQVVVAPVDSSTASHSNERSRGRNGRNSGKGKGRGRNGRRSRSRSRSRDRPRAQHTRKEELEVPNEVPNDVTVAATTMGVAAMDVAGTEQKPVKDGRQGAGGKNSKKRKRNEKNELGKRKRGGRGRKKVGSEMPVFALSDVSGTEEETDDPFPLSFPVGLRSAAPGVAAVGFGAGTALLGSQGQVINLASDTESE